MSQYWFVVQLSISLSREKKVEQIGFMCHNLHAMGYTDIYLYSPLSSQSVDTLERRSLLLQFSIRELFRTLKSGEKKDPVGFILSEPPSFFPYERSYEVGCLNKLSEHLKLFRHAFPKMVEELASLKKAFEEAHQQCSEWKEKGQSTPELAPLQSLMQAFQPFLSACNESESLLFFLLKHQADMEILSLKMEEIDLGDWKKQLRMGFEKRGFEALLLEIDELLQCHER